MRNPMKESTTFPPNGKIGKSRHTIRQELLEMGISEVPLRILSDDELTDLLVGLKALTKQEMRHRHNAVMC